MVLTWSWARSALVLGTVAAALAGHAAASPALIVDVDSGRVLYGSEATAPWYPASLTKLMTTYVALSAVREGRITLDTPLMVSPRAARMAPSKMGFRPGTLVTLDNALKMLMVKSPNDVAVTIAEGLSGSVEAFADDMNNYAARLGLHESHFVNPNGLPDPNHVSSARDMAIIGRALLREFPEERGLFDIGVLAFGNQLISNHNGMLGRYPGADGMKTGYTCSAGYNIVLSAERDGKRLIAVVMGSPSNATRTQRAATLLDRSFAGVDDGLGSLSSLSNASSTEPPDLRPTICGRGRANAIAEAEAEDQTIPSAPASPLSALFERAGTSPVTTGPNLLTLTRTAFTPVRVFVGPVPGWSGKIARPRSMETAPVAVAAAVDPVPGSNGDRGPIEAPAPAPLALAGAVNPGSATLATAALVRKTKVLSLAVRGGPKHGRSVASTARKTATVAAVQKPAVKKVGAVAAVGHGPAKAAAAKKLSEK